MLSEHSSFSSAHWFVFRNSILWIFYLTTVVTQDPVVNIPQGRIAGVSILLYFSVFELFVHTINK